MALFRGLAKGAVVGFVAKEARKPENQRRLKNAFRSLTNRGRGGSAGTKDPRHPR
ncbi:hypothetical protein [Aquipuribacter sp. SD81]|uniref:hypothetical protein n=1 Tax=Aquipuribacter sp. SD81 TaxID=3127703 RepID=UPI003016A356